MGNKRKKSWDLVPGGMACAVIAGIGSLSATIFGGSALLYALALGMSCHYWFPQEHWKKGVQFSAGSMLRVGVGLLGIKVSLNEISAIGGKSFALVIAASALTIISGVALALLLKRRSEEGLLSGGAVAICGASAALAIFSVLPQTKENEQFTVLAVIGVTLLSTVAMVLYPLIAEAGGMGAIQSGLFLGATIHDIAQVVAAGTIISPEVGRIATVIKLLRVLLLAPVTLAIASCYYRWSCVSRNAVSNRVAPVPGFLIFFFALVLISSTGMLPRGLIEGISHLSSLLLTMGVAAIGMKISIQDVVKMGLIPIVLLVGETVFIAMFVLFWIAY